MPSTCYRGARVPEVTGAARVPGWAWRSVSEVERAGVRERVSARTRASKRAIGVSLSIRDHWEITGTL